MKFEPGFPPLSASYVITIPYRQGDPCRGIPIEARGTAYSQTGLDKAGNGDLSQSPAAEVKETLNLNCDVITFQSLILIKI